MSNAASRKKLATTTAVWSRFGSVSRAEKAVNAPPNSLTSCLAETSFLTLFFRLIGVGISCATTRPRLAGNALGSQQIQRRYCGAWHTMYDGRKENRIELVSAINLSTWECFSTSRHALVAEVV